MNKIIQHFRNMEGARLHTLTRPNARQARQAVKDLLSKGKHVYAFDNKQIAYK